MSKRWFFLVILLLITLPSALCATGMGGMGMGMGGMVDKVYLQTRDVGKVEFSHSMHGPRCAECHPKIFEKKRSATRISMKAMEAGKSCGACHDGKKAFSVKANCTKCHAGDILYVEKDAGDVDFTHSFHVEVFGCDACHPDLFKAQRGKNKATMEEMEKGKSCGACHDGSTAFGVADACDSCHKM
jgi:c(7)-type cytochrome triheme protein